MSSVETVLLVDDTRSDALLYSALLRRAAGTPRSVEHASTLEEALALLGKRDYDAVLLDLGLPDSDGLGGIRRIAGRYPDLPVVVLTGRDEDDIGEHAIAAGAAEYLHKSEARSDAIDRVLRHARARKQLERRAREAHEALLASRRRLAQSERRYRDIFEHGLGFICTHDLDGILLSINPAAAAALGTTPSAVLGRPLREFMPAAERVHFDSYMQRMRERGHDQGLLPVMRRSGETRTWRYHNRLLDRDGEEAVVLGIAHDVTDRLQMERQLRDRTAELKAVNDAAPLGLLRTDAGGRCTYVNRAWEQIAGISEEEALGDGWARALHPDDRGHVVRNWARTHAAGEQFSGRQRYMHADGRVVWCKVHAAPMVIDGAVAGYFATVQDITREHESESARRRGERRLATLADALPLLLMFVDAELRVEFINSGWTRELRRPPERILGHPVHELISGPAASHFAEGLEIARGGVEHSAEFDDPDETAIRTWNATFIPQLDQAGQVDGIHVMLRDVTLDKAYRQDLVRRAEQDPLTGCLNRAGFQARGQHAWDEAARQGRPIGVFFFDLDGFKDINDTLGHAAGDGLLQEVAARVRDCVRADDIVARMGGDEFAVVARHVTGEDAASRLAEKLLAVVQDSWRQVSSAPDAQALHASCSLGYCIADATVTSLGQALERADEALYAAKRAGKGRALPWRPPQGRTEPA